jgi:hypothetical protein
MGTIIEKGSDLDFFQMYQKGISYKNPELLNQCQVALQAFLGLPKKKIKRKIQAMSQIQATGVGVSTDFPLITADNFNVTIEMDNFDMGWEQSFRQVTLTKDRLFWEIYNVANSLTFYKVEEGQKIEVAGLTGSKVTANAEYYGGAIGWTDEMIRSRKVPAMVDLATIFRNKFWVNKANIHYALLAVAAALTTVAWQGVAADGRTLRDILTINEGAYQLGNTNKDKGYGDTANMPLNMYANMQDEERIEAAFRVTSGQLVAARENGIAITGRRIRRIYTFNSNIVAGSPILVLPGQKIQKADAMQPTPYGPELDILSLNRVQAVWAIYGAIVGDDEQCIQLTLGDPS